MFFHSQFDATRQYLNSLHLSAIVTVVMTTTSLLHIAWNFFFVTYLQLGITGIGLATMISYTWNCIVINTILMCNKSFKESFFWFTAESYREGMAEYLRVGVPSAVMLCLEWGAFELLALTASLISVDATGAQIIAYNAYLVFMMVPWGGQVGTLVCVGKAMGEGNSVKAITLLKVATAFMFVVDSIMCALIIINTDSLALFFTSNQAVLTHLHPTFMVMALQLLFQGIQVISGGGLKALGLQSKASVIVLVSQYLGTIPFGYLFAIVLERGIVGIWEGLILGGTVQMVLFLYVLRFQVRWEEMAV